MSGYLTNPDAVRFFDLLDKFLRRPDTFTVDDATGAFLTTFVPPLTSTEQTNYDLLVKVNKATLVDLTPTERASLDTRLATGRTFLAFNQSQWRALTQVQRDDALLDNVSALWRVIFLLLRDS